MILLDTNIFLELMLGRTKSKDCERLLVAVSEGKKEAVVTRFSIHAIESTLADPSLTLAFLRNVESSVGLATYDTSTADEMAVSMLMEEMKLDFDDTLQYYVAKRLGVDSIVSFDKHLGGLDIPRVEPADVLKGLRS